MIVPSALALATLLAAATPSKPPVLPGAYADESGRTLYAALNVDSDGAQVNWLDPQRQTAGITATIPQSWRLTQQLFERRTIVQAPQGPLGVSLLIHGNDAQTRDMGFLAPLYVLNGVNVVTYDQRGTGRRDLRCDRIGSASRSQTHRLVGVQQRRLDCASRCDATSDRVHAVSWCAGLHASGKHRIRSCQARAACRLQRRADRASR